ncbi:MAG: acyl-CoA dehydrogenase family protein [Solirubrobacterales bacterium]
MYFDLNDTQRQIKETAHGFLTSKYRSERVRELLDSEQGFEESDWKEMAELGWAGLALPEEHGGLGLGAVELAVVFEEIGYSIVPTPLLSTTIAGLALAAGGSEEQREAYLAPLAEGTRRGTVALWDEGTQARIGEWTMEARTSGDGVVLDGAKVLVLDAASADFMLVATSDGRRHIVPTDADGVTIAREESIDLTRRFHTVRFDGVEVPAERTLPAEGDAYWPVFGRVCVALSAELTGIAQRCLEMSVAYAGERQQFGRPIGAYQAVSHRCASMLMGAENSRSLTYYAAWAADAEPDSLQRAASMAKAYASDAGWHVAHEAIQVHGGIGFTWEHDLHLYLKRARVDAALFGDARWHRERVAEGALAVAA